MSETFEIRTARLRIRSWRDDDFEAYAAMNADPRVMEFFPGVLSREESRERFARGSARLAERGYGLWPVEVIGGSPFIGICGLAGPDFTAHFTPAVEIGWRLAAEHWGQGYATEAARAVLAFGFEKVGLPEIVSFTTAANVRSRRVMEKLGLQRSPGDDFLHPLIAEGHPLRPHVLYRLRREAFTPSGD
ncbi:MAG TPA: GNAT family N-acetyltransferase [Polyangia bacterium]